MNTVTTKQIEKLWNQYRELINTAYQLCKDPRTNPDTFPLRDYTECAYCDDLHKLLETETANERQHRRGAPRFAATISAYTAAKLLLMNQSANGWKAETMPPATIFLSWRATAATAYTIGFLCRGVEMGTWAEQVSRLDYAKLMKN